MTDNGRNLDGKDLTIGDYANGAPNIRLSQIPASLGRQIPWMIPALVLMLGASWYFTKDINRTYTADGRILVQLGPEYVYNPATGNGSNNSGITITPDQVVLTEIDIIKNSQIIDQVINQMISSPANGGVGGERFAPKLYEKWVSASAENKIDAWNDIIKFVDRNYVVMPKPKSSIVNLVYKHEDGDVAVKTLRAFMAAYQSFRKDIFVLETTGQIAERRSATEDQLNEIEGKIQRILNKNGISEFATEQAGVQKRAEDQKAALNKLRGQISAVEAALAATEDQLRATPATINLYVDDRASQRLAQAELEKRQLLAKYLPTSNPVRAKEVEISQIREQISANGGQAAGGRRVGPNTVYQALMTQRNTYQAQADSYREQEITLQAQLNVAQASVTRLRKLGPTYASLLREKNSLEERLKSYNTKEGEALVNRAVNEASSENIKIITTPTMPRKGRNMRKIMFALASLGSIFSVMMLALLRVFLDPRLYGPDPAQRIKNTGGRGRRRADYNEIPEPVPAYAKVYDSQPTQVPAAAVAAHVPSSHTDVSTKPAAPVPAYAQAYEPSHQVARSQAAVDPYAPEPYVPHSHDGQQMYADGSLASTPPYVSREPVAYPTQPIENYPQATQAYAGAQEDVPVLGSTGPGPYTG
jgi:uncharacterized protein involved in exopolysaccharide biosynthesis